MNKLLTLYPNLKTAENTPMAASFSHRNKYASLIGQLASEYETVFRFHACYNPEIVAGFKSLFEFKAMFLAEGKITEENYEKFKVLNGLILKDLCHLVEVAGDILNTPGFKSFETLHTFIGKWHFQFEVNLDWYTSLAGCEEYWNKHVEKKHRTKKHANWIPSTEELQVYWDGQVEFAEGVINRRLFFAEIFLTEVQKMIENQPRILEKKIAAYYLCPTNFRRVKPQPKVEAKAELKAEYEAEIREGCEVELKDESEGEPESTPESAPLPKVESEEKTPLQQKQERFEYLDLRYKAFNICFEGIFKAELCLEAYQIITAIKKESYDVNNRWNHWYNDGIENIIELFRLRECEFKHWNNTTFDIVDCFLKKIFIRENHSKIDELILELKLELKHSCYLVDKFEELFKICKDNLSDWTDLNEELHPEVKEVPVNPFEELINGPSK